MEQPLPVILTGCMSSAAKIRHKTENASSKLLHRFIGVSSENFRAHEIPESGPSQVTITISQASAIAAIRDGGILVNGTDD
jgi:hypothetical protein